MANYVKLDNKAYGYACDKCKRVHKTVYQGTDNIFCKEHLPQDATIVEEL